MQNTNLQVMMPTYYFNTENYDKPISVTRLLRRNFGLLSSMYQNHVINIRVNEAKSYDDYFNPYFPTEYRYISIDDIESSYLAARSSGDLMKISFIIDAKYVYTERQVYSFMEVLGQIGGVMGIFVSLGAVFTHFCSSKIYTMTLLSMLYRTDDPKQPRKIKPILTDMLQVRRGRNGMSKPQVSTLILTHFLASRRVKKQCDVTEYYFT